ncbi:MAG: plasmid recombination protein [Lachnospiraceae bacterium]|nr:plasmid recombination protein [Lachnospiraceae bacterium]
MAYAIMRISKCKTGAVSRIEKHHERKKDVYKSNPDIDVSRSDLNFHIKEPPDNYRKFIKKRIEEVGCRTRKDSVVMQDSICTASPEFFKGKTSRQKEDFFRMAYRFYVKTFGEDNIISAVVHLDERTPHMHVCFVPITKDGKLSSKTVIGGPAGLVKLQDGFYSHMLYKFPELQRGIPKRITHRKHLPTYLFKNADMLMEHFEEISQAINDISVIKSKEKKAQAIELISRYAPEMAKMKEQIKSVDKYVEGLHREIRDEKDVSEHWLGQTKKLEEEVKKKDVKIYELQAKQKELQETINRIPPRVLKDLDELERARRKTITRDDWTR